MDLVDKVLDLAGEYLLRPVQKAGQVALLGVSLMGCGDTIVNQYYGDDEAAGQEENNPSEEPGPSSGEKITFILADNEANTEQYVLRENNGRLRAYDLPVHVSTKNSICFSPDGRQIIFPSNTAGDNALRLLDVPTGDISVLVSDPTWSFKDLRWSGDAIAMEGWQESVSEIITVNKDGSGLQQMTFDEGQNTDPTWSPDGRSLVYSAGSHTGEGFGFQSQVILREEGTSRVLGMALRYAGNFSWSPDGQKIACRATTTDGQEGLYLLSLEGTLEHLANGRYSSLRWMPDGSSLVAEKMDGAFRKHLYLINATTGQETALLADSDSEDADPAVGADGGVLFISSRAGQVNQNYNVFRRSPEGNVEQLTSYEEPQFTHVPEWPGYCR